MDADISLARYDLRKTSRRSPPMPLVLGLIIFVKGLYGVNKSASSSILIQKESRVGWKALQTPFYKRKPAKAGDWTGTISSDFWRKSKSADR
jgi:hypothetical protein